MSQILTKPITKIVVSLLSATATVAFLLPQITLAQSLETDPSQDYQRQNGADPFSGSSTGQSFSPFDLIHRANLGSDRDPDEVSAEQRQNLDAEAAEFKVLQRQRLQLPQNPALTNNSPNTNTTETRN